jgi:hypothetical protein
MDLMLMARSVVLLYNATYAAIPTRTAMSAGAALLRVGRPAETAFDEVAALAEVPEAETAATLLAAVPEALAVEAADAETEDWVSAELGSRSRGPTYSCAVDVVNRGLNSRIPRAGHTCKREAGRVGLVVVLRVGGIFERERCESDKVVWA